MSKIKLQLFGNPMLLVDGSVVEFSRRKSLALLTYLAVSQEQHSRESLAVLFWPEKDSLRAQANLRNVIYSLKKSPVAGILDMNRKNVSINAEVEIWVDVNVFRQCLVENYRCDHGPDIICKQCLNRYAQAVELFQDTFMAGFTVHDSTEFEQWQFMESQSLQREYLRAVEKLIRFHETHLDWDAVIAYARRIIALDSLDESAHRRLMTIYAKSGKKSDAIHQYRECCRNLENELETEPDPETTALFERIRSGKIQSSSINESINKQSYRLPYHPTPFVGRKQELAQINEILSQPGHRILTLTGPGGSGKTRLALQAAEDFSENWSDGVVWIPLVSVDSVDFIVSTIVQCLNLQIARVDTGAESTSLPDLSQLKAQLIFYLEKRRMLLVLDNFEHLSEGANILSDLLQTAPKVQFLITSRERLNLHGEWVFETRGLTYPVADTEEILEENDAVTLFVQSAQQASSTFNLMEKNKDHVAQICRIVHGIPLAIELSASWVKVLSCREIVREIQSNLDFLSSSLQDIPHRHRSIRAVFEQSWRMLTPEGRACFRKLAVFRGGFSRQAAGDIAKASYQALASLMDKSIIQRITNHRFEIHELLRQYAEERLENVPRESEVVRTRHSQHFLNLLKKMELPLKQGDQKNTVRTLSIEMENIRTAWFWAAETHNYGLLLDSSMGLFLYYDLRNQFHDGQEMFRKAYQALDSWLHDTRTEDDDTVEDKHVLAGFLLGIQGWFLRYSQPVVAYDHSQPGIPHVEAFQLMNQGLGFLEPYIKRVEWAVINILAIFLKQEWTEQTAIDRLQQCLKIFRADSWGISLTYHTMGCWYWYFDLALSEDYQKKSLAIRKKTNDQWGAAMSHYLLGFIALRMDKLAEAKRHFLESLEIRRRLGEDHNGLIESLQEMGKVAVLLEEYDEAFRYYEESLVLSEKMTNFYRTALILGAMGTGYFKWGRYREAADYLNRCLTLCSSSGFEKLHAQFLEILNQIKQ